MKRRKFLKSTALAAVATAIPVAVLAKKPEVVTGIDLATGDDYTVVHGKQKPDLVRIFRAETDGKSVTVQGLDETGEVVRETLSLAEEQLYDALSRRYTKALARAMEYTKTLS